MGAEEFDYAAERVHDLREQLEAAALASGKVQSFLAGKPIKKVVVVPGKLVNVVI